MKTKFFLLTALIFFSTNLFSQIKTVKPLAQKTVVTTPVLTKTSTPQPEKPLTQKTVVSTPVIAKHIIQQPGKTENPPSTADFTGAQIYILTGENGKSTNTIFSIEIYDSKNLKAADYSEAGLTTPVEDDRYKGHIKYVPYVPVFTPGDKVELSAQLDGSEPWYVEVNGIMPTTVTRNAIFSDFVNGGSISIFIFPKTLYPLLGPDTWKINTLTIYLSFDKDPASPHIMTWNGITLSPSALSRTFKFDKKFKPIQ